MSLPTIMTRDRWLAERLAELEAEKDLTVHHDAVSTQRRQLPMVEATTPYEFDEPAGTVTLADTLGGRRQLIVYHLMFHPERRHRVARPDGEARTLEGDTSTTTSV